MILQKMKKTAEDYLGQDVDRAVITVPAYFNDSQRQATKEAGEIAGLKLNESSMSQLRLPWLMVWIKRYRSKDCGFDFGGGTHDVSILELGMGCLKFCLPMVIRI